MTFDLVSFTIDVHAKGGRNVPLCLCARGKRCTVMHRGCEAETKGLLHGYEWRLRFGALELRFG